MPSSLVLPRESILPHPRLFQFIDRSTARLIWISGLPGSGKTMLAASYAEQAGRPCVWLRLDRLDRDPASFFLHFTQAVIAARLDTADKLPNLAPEQLADLTSFVRMYCRALFHRCPKRLLLVLDDVQEAQDAAFLSSCLPAFAQTLPPDTTMLAISRQGLPPELVRGLVNREVAEMEPTALLCTVEESKALLAQRQDNLDSMIAHRLHALTHGWVAGLVLYGTLLARKALEPENLSGTLPKRVRDYFDIEVIKALAPADLDRLILTAWLPYVTPQMTAHLTGSPEVPLLLARLAGRGFFVSEHRNAQVQYRYHHLFQRMLQDLASERLPTSSLSLPCSSGRRKWPPFRPGSGGFHRNWSADPPGCSTGRECARP